MYLITTWKTRPLSPDQFNRLMTVWGKLEQQTAADDSSERLCWYSYSDGSGGLTVDKVADVDRALAIGLETSLSLSEFIDLETRIGVDMESALPQILKAQEHANS